MKTIKRGQSGQPITFPLGRLEPGTVMVDFIRALTKDCESVNSNYYLGKDDMDGDNSDNGHFTIDVNDNN